VSAKQGRHGAGDYRVIDEVHAKEVVVLVIRIRHHKDAY